MTETEVLKAEQEKVEVEDANTDSDSESGDAEDGDAETGQVSLLSDKFSICNKQQNNNLGLGRKINNNLFMFFCFSLFLLTRVPHSLFWQTKK